MFDIVVVGAGIVGSLIARELSQYQLDILVIDKENDVGNVTSMANSAIIHSGYDPLPGSLKAKLNVLGNKMFSEVASDLDVHFERIGSLTVAIYNEQLPLLKELALRSKENGVEVKLLTAEEVKKMEPNISSEVKGALFAPTAGIINPFTLTVHAMENAVDNGVKLSLGEEVKNIINKEDYFEIVTSKNTYQSKIVINAAGVYSDKIHSFIEDINYQITAKKGEYFVLDHYKKGLVNHVIFPLPSEKGKGILVSPTTSGNYIVGPSSEINLDKDSVSTDKETLNNVRSQALSLVPSIPFNQVIRTFSGNRPTPSTHDFIIGYAKTSKHFLNVSGIESPGLASSPAIAKYVVDNFVKNIIELKKNSSFNPKVRKRIHLNELTIEQKNELISKNKDYGTIICNCEKVTLGEIKDELSRSVPPRSVKALKKRTRAGFGKCQGGFCQPLVIKELSKHFNVDMKEILLDKNDSNICRYKTKEENQK